MKIADEDKTKQWLMDSLGNDYKQAVNSCFNRIGLMNAWEGRAVHGYIVNNQTAMVNVLKNGNEITEEKQLFHASAGTKKCTTTIFYVEQQNEAHVVAFGEHKTNKSYKVIDTRDCVNFPSNIAFE